MLYWGHERLNLHVYAYIRGSVYSLPCANVYPCVIFTNVCIYIKLYIFTNPSAWAGYDTRSIWVECLPMVWETGAQSQRLKKWYLMPPCLTLSIIQYGSKLKWSNPGNGVTPSPISRWSSYWKGSLLVTLD